MKPRWLFALALVAVVGFSGGTLLALNVPWLQPGNGGNVAADQLLDMTDVQPLPGEGDPPPVEDASPPMTGELRLGSTMELARATVSGAGGSVEVSKAGDSLDGLRIDVPSGAYDADVSFSVSSTAISGATFPAVRPITPLITVEDGGAVAKAAIKVTIPAKIPDGAFAMAFHYDDATHAIEPLALLDETATSLTVGTGHFSGYFAGLVDLAKLSTTADSGFRPGVDDWQFPNAGSYVAPDGHCEGQSITAIWYYIQQRRKAGASPLYGLYDNNGAAEKTPTLWSDDSDGYRLASVVQADPIAVKKWYDFFTDVGRNSRSYRLQYNAFWTAIAATGEPQLVQMTSTAGDAHTMIVYRVTRDRIFVADPNYPGRLRTIAWDDARGVLGPYSSGDNAKVIASGGGATYVGFGYMPANLSSSNAALEKHWQEFQAGTIGTGVFPAYRLEAKTGQDSSGREVWEPLTDGFRTQNDHLAIRIVDPRGVSHASMRLYRSTSAVPLERGLWIRTNVNLEEGENSFGILEMGAKPGTSWDYVDFERIRVVRGEANLSTDRFQFTITDAEHGGDLGWGDGHAMSDRLTLNAVLKQVVFSVENGTVTGHGEGDLPGSPVTVQQTGGGYDTFIAPWSFRADGTFDPNRTADDGSPQQIQGTFHFEVTDTQMSYDEKSSPTGGWVTKQRWDGTFTGRREGNTIGGRFEMTTQTRQYDPTYPDAEAQSSWQSFPFSFTYSAEVD